MPRSGERATLPTPLRSATPPSVGHVNCAFGGRDRSRAPDEPSTSAPRRPLGRSCSCAPLHLGGHGAQVPVAPCERASETVSSGRWGRRRRDGRARRGRAAPEEPATAVHAAALSRPRRGARGCAVRRARLGSRQRAPSAPGTERTRARPPRTSASAGRPSPADAGDRDHRPLRRHHPADGQRQLSRPRTFSLCPDAGSCDDLRPHSAQACQP